MAKQELAPDRWNAWRASPTTAQLQAVQDDLFAVTIIGFLSLAVGGLATQFTSDDVALIACVACQWPAAVVTLRVARSRRKPSNALALPFPPPKASRWPSFVRQKARSAVVDVLVCGIGAVLVGFFYGAPPLALLAGLGNRLSSPWGSILRFIADAVVAVAILLFVALVAIVYFSVKPAYRAAKTEYQEALRNIASPATVKLRELRQLVETLRKQSEATVRLADEVERALDAQTRVAEQQERGLREVMEAADVISAQAKETELVNEMGEERIRAAASVLERTRRSERKADRRFGIRWTVLSLIFGAAIGAALNTDVVHQFIESLYR